MFIGFTPSAVAGLGSGRKTEDTSYMERKPTVFRGYSIYPEEQRVV
jgi:hypothetical protein